VKTVAVRPILLLGNPGLYRPSSPVREEDLASMGTLVRDLRDTLVDFRSRRGSARAIAAPQIGVWTRVVYVHEPEPQVVLNPVVLPQGTSEVDVWESCMSFPDLLVRVRRRRSCRVSYRDQAWRELTRDLTAIPAAVLQHECDHLEGVLAVARAIDAHSFCLSSQRCYVVRSCQPVGGKVLRRTFDGC
jgi:peptide deformylase